MMFAKNLTDAGTMVEALVPHGCFYSSYLLGSRIDEGTFGRFHRCTKIYIMKPGRVDFAELDFAVKIVDVTEKPCERFEHERNIWKLIGSHKHVLECRDVFLGQGCGYFVTEPFSGSVFQAFRDDQIPQGPEAARIFSEMLLGIKHLHCQAIAHRDIQPGSFVLSQAKGIDDRIAQHVGVVKLCEFGTAEFLCNLKKPNTRLCGTTPYMSPEMLNFQGYSDKTDIWSLGVSAYFLLFGAFPYYSDCQDTLSMSERIRTGIPAPDYRVVENRSGCEPSKQAAEFVKALLAREQAQRPAAQQALRLALVRPQHAVLRKAASLLKQFVPSGKQSAGGIGMAALQLQARMDLTPMCARQSPAFPMVSASTTCTDDMLISVGSVSDSDSSWSVAPVGNSDGKHTEPICERSSDLDGDFPLHQDFVDDQAKTTVTCKVSL